MHRRQFISGVPAGLAGFGALAASGQALAATDPLETSDKFGVVSVKDFGAVGDGVADDLAAIEAAIAYIDSRGGGIVDFGKGRYRLSNTLHLGNGSANQVSTRHHRITLRGAGKGSDETLDFQQQQDVTELIYDGPVSAGAAVIQFNGPLHAMNVFGIMANCNGKAGRGYQIVHVTDGLFWCFAKRYTYAGFVLTTQTATPPGCAYGCANNTFVNCSASVPANPQAYGLVLTSGSPGNGLIDGDAANNDFIGGAFSYGGSDGSAGLYLEGCDNNQFFGVQFIAQGGNDGKGYGVFFQPWPGDRRFPLENAFYNLGLNQKVGGVCGTLGNVMVVHQEGDGAPLPLLDHLTVLATHNGRMAINGKRSYRVRDFAQALLEHQSQVTTSTAFVAVPGLGASLSAVKDGSRIKLDFSARVAKSGGGSGQFVLNVNGSDQPSTLREVAASSDYASVAATLLLPVQAGDYAVSVRYRSSDGNAVAITDAALLLEEFY
ncbi:hypothetical protein AZ78_1774 [Lysobacter capsici AZ78]|uniref:Rhamnogalacturonase A/B/Epimerase-like pectate lyase domain-containing protein n=1 Tax=Lysobacter capsici AZ78 TaxID=1444315 RepID=A0A108U7Y2_9GAMM|nr:glycosyl hydrolase family 28-related protein [Lysobacter capsici]KWS04225.1 hypothetical protein AZ78_1774 [Lysobacter capsici AZ78]